MLRNEKDTTLVCHYFKWLQHGSVHLRKSVPCWFTAWSSLDEKDCCNKSPAGMFWISSACAVLGIHTEQSHPRCFHFEDDQLQTLTFILVTYPVEGTLM